MSGRRRDGAGARSRNRRTRYRSAARNRWVAGALPHSARTLQDVDIALEGSRGDRFSLLQHGNAPAREIEAVVTGMRDQAEVLQPIVGDAVGVNKVADIDQISLKQLIERPGRVASELQGRDRPLLECREGMGNESLRP